MDEADKDAPVIKLVHSIIAEAIEQGASDIHIDPGEGDMRVLLRIDGVLSQTATLKRSMADERDLAREDHVRDGHLRAARAAGRALRADRQRAPRRRARRPRCRSSTARAPTCASSTRASPCAGWSRLGMQRTEQDRFAYAIARPNGAVLVTGPTGSGKSTTLYAALGAVNDGSRSILTIEDPVESRIAGVKQMQVAPEGRHDLRGRLARDAARRPRRDHGRARSATAKPPTSRSRRRSPATSCSRPCTRAMPPARSAA